MVTTGSGIIYFPPLNLILFNNGQSSKILFINDIFLYLDHRILSSTDTKLFYSKNSMKEFRNLSYLFAIYETQYFVMLFKHRYFLYSRFFSNLDII